MKRSPARKGLGAWGVSAAALAALLPLGAAAHLVPPGSPVLQTVASPGLEELRERARRVLRGIHDRRLPMAEARREVERIRRDLLALGEAEGWTPVVRRLEIPIPRRQDLGPALSEECPLFFEEELVRFCPVDASHSEIWGDQVLVCGFTCAPGETGPADGAAGGR